jgi:ATP-dependent DNA helicase RecG
MDANSRRNAALAAIEAVRNGAVADTAETELVDFKEERGTFDKATKTRRAVDPRHEPAAQALAEEVGCFANSDSGGVLVVGVDDKASGADAFVGAHLDVSWLRERIYSLTQPNVSVDLIEELTVEGRRIYLINVAPGLEEVRVGGKLRARFSTGCEELSGDRARDFLERRRRFDWTAESSGLRLSDAEPAALESARRHYEEQRGAAAPTSDAGFARRLGITLDESDDPELTRAGALLLCRFEPGNPQLDVLLTTAEGAASIERSLSEAPLLTAFDQAWDLIVRSFPARSSVIGAQRRSVRAIPEPALREALVNALMHRDHRQARGNVVAIITGDPPAALKVQSPGGFPLGVQRDRLLTTRSQPRNPALASAFRVLGLAETEGVGIDTMFRVMLRDGHPEPDIDDRGGDVVCRLTGGSVDVQVRDFFDELAQRDRSLGDDTRVYIAITDLLQRTPLRPARLADIAQSSEDEAFELLRRLAKIGVLEPLVSSGRSFRLSDRSREQLRGRITYQVRQSIEEQWDLVRAFLDVNPAIGREDAARLLSVTPERASTVLSKLYNRLHRIEPVSNARGRGVRYRPTEASRADGAAGPTPAPTD